MNKKMIALALAAAFAAPAAFADTGTVKISGYLNLSLDRLDTDSGGANDKSWYVSSNASNIVFSGDEPLGNGLKAIWQMQNFVSFGSGNGSDAWTNGNSFLGLQGGWGTMLMGRNDTPMKVLGRKVDLFGNQIGDARNLTSESGAAPGGQGFDARPGNVIQYNSPAWSGFQASIQYSPEEGVVDGDRWSTSLGYENGPLLLGLAFERHNAGVGGVAVEDEDAWRLAAGYSFGNTRVVGLFQKANDIDGVNNADRKVWGLGAAHKFGAHTIKAQYYKADDLDNVNDTGANMWALGWDYAFSKRTTAYVAYARTSNDTFADYSAFGGGHGDNPGTVANGDPSGFSFGMVHKF